MDGNNAQQLRRFVPRATRYFLRPDDNKFMKFAHERPDTNETQGLHDTIMVNLSRTGLGFLVDRDMAPNIGDLVKVEFPVPGRKDGSNTLACWARVARVQEYTQNIWWLKDDPKFHDLVFVGVQFQDMTAIGEVAIQTGIDRRMTALIQQHRRERWNRLWLWFQFKGWKFFAILVTAFAVFFSLYYLTLPDDKYDSKRGAPWGERYKLFE